MDSAKGKMQPTTLERGYVLSGDADSKQGIYVSQVIPENPSGETLLICPPLGEERLHSVRYLHLCAEFLAANLGITVARFDYRGVGDSGGRDVEMSLKSLTEDALTVAHELSSLKGFKHLSIMGVRTGGLVALSALRELNPSSVVLISPVLVGADYISDIKRTRSIRGSLTVKGGVSASSKNNAEHEDFDGVVYSKKFLSELADIDFTSKDAPSKARTLLIELSPRTRLSKRATKFAEINNGDITTLPIRSEPFWLGGGKPNPTLIMTALKEFYS